MYDVKYKKICNQSLFKKTHRINKLKIMIVGLFSLRSFLVKNKKNSLFFILLIFIECNSQSFNINSIDENKISITAVNNLPRDLIVYPHSYAFDLQIIDETGNVMYTFNYTENLFNNAYNYYLSNKNIFNNINPMDDRKFIYLKYINSDYIIIPKKSDNYLISFPLFYDCPLDNSCKSNFTVPFDSEKKYFLKGRMKINYTLFEQYIKNNMDNKKFKLIKEIKIPLLEIKNIESLFCDKELT